jgi:hypothetical protein
MSSQLHTSTSLPPAEKPPVPIEEEARWVPELVRVPLCCFEKLNLLSSQLLFGHH